MRRLSVAVERYPLAAPFTIARGSRTEAIVIVVTIEDGSVRGRGECVPYARYGETVESVHAQIEGIREAVEARLDRDGLQHALPPGAARNALDCALWDFEAKRLGVRAHAMAAIHRLGPATTAFTISLGPPAAMAEAARIAAHRPLLKIKLGSTGDAERIVAVRAAAPEATLIVDANEGWSAETLDANVAACLAADVALIEQPLPAAEDHVLADRPRPIPLCADESVHTRSTLSALRDRYDAINIKLDKTGGVTEALALAEAASTLGFGLFVGCMVGTSLAMAPAMLLAPRARFVDLDGPLLLASDRSPGLRYDGSTVFPPEPDLWG